MKVKKTQKLAKASRKWGKKTPNAKNLVQITGFAERTGKPKVTIHVVAWFSLARQGAQKNQTNQDWLQLQENSETENGS